MPELYQYGITYCNTDLAYMPIRESKSGRGECILNDMSGITDWTRRFEKRFLQLKAEKRISQESLAERLNVKQTTISRWKAGKRTPSLEQFEDLAKALEVPLEWLLFGDVARLSEEESELIYEYRHIEPSKRFAVRDVVMTYSAISADPKNDEPGNGGNAASGS